MCCSSTVCIEWALVDVTAAGSGVRKHEPREKKKEKKQISKNSFVCTMNVNGKKFNSFCLFHRKFPAFGYLIVSAFVAPLYLFTENVFVWTSKFWENLMVNRAKKSKERSEKSESSWMKMKWKCSVARHIQREQLFRFHRTIYAASNYQTDSCHNPSDKLEHIHS